MALGWFVASRGLSSSCWAPIEPILRDFAPINIGSPKENPVTLVSADWEDIFANNPDVLNAAGGPRGGPWGIFVECDGDYEIMPYSASSTRAAKRPPWLGILFSALREGADDPKIEKPPVSADFRFL